MRRLWLAWFAPVLFVACGLAERQALMRERYPTYPPAVQEAITHGQVLEGMTPEQVYLAFGVTLCKQSSYYQGRQMLVWAYEPNPFTGRPAAGTYNCNRASQRIYFENGRVVGWDNL
jgi:hypothetical protein